MSATEQILNPAHVRFTFRARERKSRAGEPTFATALGPLRERLRQHFTAAV